MHNPKTRHSRRWLIRSAGAAAIAAPHFWIPAARAAQQLVVRTPGGVFDDVKRKAVYDPFLKATGNEIVPVAATVAKLLAMYKSGQVEIDVIDSGDDVIVQFGKAGSLVPIAYNTFKYTDPKDLDPVIKGEFHVGSFIYGMVMGYDAGVFAPGKEPKSWAEFWDAKAFPGPRSLADMATGQPALEFALIADGVPMDKLYPLDLDRAFKSLSRIRPSIPKFWDTGALSAQMLADKEVALSAIWSTRLFAAIGGGARLGAQWNQNALLVQAYGVSKGSKNIEAAMQFVDFSLSKEIQSDWLKAYKAIPVNQQSYGVMAPELVDPETKLPFTRSKGFVLDINWWADNRAKVSEIWSKWILG